ncbi:MAG: DUF2807 domain-containing protein [Bacteroidota bacterium]
MKTSSKLIIGALILFWLFGTSLMIAIRANIDTEKINMRVGNNVISSTEVVVDTFQNVQRLRVRGPYKVILSNAETLSMKLEGDENLLSNIEFEMEENTLHIGQETQIDSFNVLNLHLGVPADMQLALVGWGDVESDSSFQTSWLALDGDGAAKMSIQSNTLYLHVRGGKAVTLSGAVKLLNLNGRGEQALDASALSVEEAVIMQTKSFSSKLHVAHRLIIAENDRSTIAYTGSPEVMEPLYKKGEIIPVGQEE